jgi:phosphoglycolate phosphatase-like HAD superfamily hydrolase
MSELSPIYAFDFDGVICDSAIETASSGWKTALELWTDMPSTLPPELLDKFRQVRPILETGYEATLIMRLLFEGMDVNYLIEHFHQQMNVLMIRDELTVQELKQLFGQVRDQWIEADFASWIEQNPLFKPVAEKLGELDVHDVVIITTKQERFVDHILKANDIHFPVGQIYGLDRNMSKQHTLNNLKIEQHRPILFIEDRLPTLLNVIDAPELSDLTLYLADWGYNTTEDRAQAQELARIEVVSLEKIQSL